MKDYIEERAMEITEYIIETKATVRQAAKKFGATTLFLRNVMWGTQRRKYVGCPDFDFWKFQSNI